MWLEDLILNLNSRQLKLKPKMISCKIPLRILETIVLLVLLFPLVISFLLLMLLIRLIISNLAKVFRKDLDSLIQGRSAGFALDIFYYYEKPFFPIIVKIDLEGKPVSLETLQAEVSRVLQVSDNFKVNQNGYGSDSGQRKLRQIIRTSHRLTQFVESWLGIFFWKTDKTFRIENHVRSIHVQGSVEESANQIQCDMLWKPFAKNQSPWELIQVTSANDNNNSALILRIHHVLGDGHAILGFLISDLCRDNSLNAEPLRKLRQFPEQTDDSGLTVRKCLKRFAFPFCSAYHVVKYFSEAQVQDIFTNKALRKAKTHLLIDSNEESPSTAQIYISPDISWRIFKEVKDSHHVSFTAVLLTSLGGALQDYLFKEGLLVPKSISCFVLLPFPNHPEAPDEFCNHMTGCIIQMPLGNLSAQTRLMITEKNIQAAKNSTFPISFFYLTDIAGLPFHWLTLPFFGNALATTVSSNFIGPPSKIVFKETVVTGCTFVAGFGPGNVSLALSSLSYNGNVRVGLTLNNRLVPARKSAISIAENIEKELHVLLQST